VEYQEEGECKRDDENFAHVSAWEYAGEGKAPILNKEPLVYEEIHMSTRSYK
jgi:succinate dehydrogenase / fumarate reductase flavoprotein subunit